MESICLSPKLKTPFRTTYGGTLPVRMKKHDDRHLPGNSQVCVRASNNQITNKILEK